MTDRDWHKIWIGQCEAAETIKLRNGLKAAFDYAVAEKLRNFAGAAAQHPEFARELPRFVSRERRDRLGEAPEVDALAGGHGVAVHDGLEVARL